MFAALLLITITGLALFGLMVAVQKFLLGHWHDSAVGTER
jgi:NitT/TauT family transport system permease protein